MASKRHRLSISPPTSLNFSSPSPSHEESCFSALILQAAAIQTLKEVPYFVFSFADYAFCFLNLKHLPYKFRLLKRK